MNRRYHGCTIEKLTDIYGKKFITNEDDNIICVCSMSIILLIFMCVICFTFIIHRFCMIYQLNKSVVKESVF